METVLGIDGGGTKTAAVILDSAGRVLGAGEGGPSTYGVVADEVTRASIETAAWAACRAAALPAPIFSAAFLGLGNVVSELDRRAVRAIAAGLGLAPAEKIGVDHDCRVALAGGLSGRPGIVLIAGTGTSTFGMNARQQAWRSGGWGPLIDDEGSSYWLGIQAMHAAILDYDGRGRPTRLTEMVQRRLQLGDINEIMNRLYAAGMTRTEIAALSPLVFEAARQGDSAAEQILNHGCQAMADCVQAVAKKLGMDSTRCELAVVGGLTNAGPAFLQPLTAAVGARLPGCQVTQAELSPALGAGILALQILHSPLDPAVIAAIRAEANKKANKTDHE